MKQKEHTHLHLNTLLTHHRRWILFHKKNRTRCFCWWCSNQSHERCENEKAIKLIHDARIHKSTVHANALPYRSWLNVIVINLFTNCWHTHTFEWLESTVTVILNVKYQYLLGYTGIRRHTIDYRIILSHHLCGNDAYIVFFIVTLTLIRCYTIFYIHAHHIAASGFSSFLPQRRLRYYYSTLCHISSNVASYRIDVFQP